MIQRVARESGSSSGAFVAKTPNSPDEMITQPSSQDNQNQYPQYNNNLHNNPGKKNHKNYVGRNSSRDGWNESGNSSSARGQFFLENGGRGKTHLGNNSTHRNGGLHGTCLHALILHIIGQG